MYSLLHEKRRLMQNAFNYRALAVRKVIILHKTNSHRDHMETVPKLRCGAESLPAQYMYFSESAYSLHVENGTTFFTHTQK